MRTDWVQELFEVQSLYLEGEGMHVVADRLLSILLERSNCQHGFFAELDPVSPGELIVHAVQSSRWWDSIKVTGDLQKPEVVQLQFEKNPGTELIMIPMATPDQVLGWLGLETQAGTSKPELLANLEPLVKLATTLLVAHRRCNELLAHQGAPVRASDEKMHLAVEGTSEGFWEYEVQSGKMNFSDSWLSHFGYEKKDLPTLQQFLSRIPEEERARFVEGLETHCRGKTYRFEFEHRIRRMGGGDVPVLCRGKVVHWSEAGAPVKVLGTHIDLTELRQAQTHLSAAQRSLVQTAKFSALGEMAAGLAHEINNPLAILQANVEVLEGFAQLNEARVERLRGSMQKSVDRIKKIVQGLRKIARDGESDPFERVDLKGIVDEVMVLVQENILRKKVTLKKSVVEGLWVQGQPVQLAQVLLNLIHNAVDVIEDLPDRWIEIEGKVEGDNVVLRVMDSGPGVPKDLESKIFDPFFTTKSPGKGIGLGLSVALSVVHHHSGRFFYDSSAAYSTFVLELKFSPGVRVASAA